MAGMAVRALNLRSYADRVLLSFLGSCPAPMVQGPDNSFITSPRLYPAGHPESLVAGSAKVVRTFVGIAWQTLVAYPIAPPPNSLHCPVELVSRMKKNVG